MVGWALQVSPGAMLGPFGGRTQVGPTAGGGWQEPEPFHSGSWHAVTFIDSPALREAQFRTGANADLLLQGLCVLLLGCF